MPRYNLPSAETFRNTLATLFCLSLVIAIYCVAPQAQIAVPEPDAMAAAAARGDWQQARLLALSAVNADRSSATAWTYLGLANEHFGDNKQALRDFGEAVRLAPQATFAHNNYGAALEANGRANEAMAQYRASLQLDREQPAALVNLARVLTANGAASERKEARELLRSAWELAPDPEIARSALLLAPCASEPSPVSSPPPELSGYARAIAESSSAVPAQERTRVGDALLRCALNDSAGAYYEALLLLDPKNAEAIAGKAQAQLASGHSADAGRTLESAVVSGLESPIIYAALAQVYQRTGHLDHAVDALRRALELAPANDALQFRYGMLLLDAHAPRATELRMQQATARSPRSSRLWFVLGLAQFDDNRPAAAQTSFDRSIALDPSFAPALAYRGLAALDQQRYAEAEQWYRRAIVADPSAADLHCLIAEALEKQHPGEPGAIRAELERALSLDPSLAVARVTLGRLALEDGRPADAARELEAALTLDSTQRQAHFYLARAYRQLHQPERAAAEAKLSSEQEANAQAAERTALQDALRQFAHTRF